MEKDFDVSSGRVAAAILAGLCSGVALAALGLPTIGHIADVVVFSIVLMSGKKAKVKGN